MEQDADANPPASQASSHFPLLEPMPGATLYELEAARREGVKRRGQVRTGCAEVDDAVLLGGLERGCVVGVSAEDIEFGILVGLQTVAHTLVSESGDGDKQRVAIITTLTPAAILPMLRDVIRAQVQTHLGPMANQKQEAVGAEVRRCLERISISRVFDIEGLWEVLSELEMPPAPPPGHDDIIPKEREVETASNTFDAAAEDKEAVSRAGSRDLLRLETSKEENKTADDIPLPQPSPKTHRMEVADSEDEEELSLSPSSLSPPEEPPIPPPPSSLPKLPSSPSLPPPLVEPAVQTTSTTTPRPVPPKNQEKRTHIPDLILITHFSALLTNLFTRSADDRPRAHSTLQALSSHLRYLARSSDGPLVMLLNSTTTTITTITTSATNTTSATATATASSFHVPAAKDRPQDPTLRSIFTRCRSKPAFGATFAQFVDVHLLCTRVPRTRSDAQAEVVGKEKGMGMKGTVRWCWVVEVLLDEVGVEVEDGDEGDNKKIWKRREQRWGAVDVRSKVRLVDAVLGG
ncbi:hypothetical protein K445DRAFT_12123 [Daldinia sp. EC12]|nr:hypothetical protein K445DRAFT_12123 [Daldinia sp. EC12]